MLLQLGAVFYLTVFNVIADGSEDNATEIVRRFRTMKYNDIWDIAFKKLKGEDLETLERILKKLDKSEIELKHQKAKGDSYDKELERMVRTHLADTLERFGLYDYTAESSHYQSVTFEDQRLNTLWTQALQQGVYQGEELSSLYDELQHIQTRIHDYHKFSEKVDQHEKGLNKQMMDDADMVSGNFGSPKDEAFTNHAKMFKEMKKDQKDKYHELKEHVDTLQKTISERPLHAPKKFSDSRVLELWNIAKTSGRFDEKELEAIQDELEHFEGRLNKLRHWERIQDQLHQMVHEDGHRDKHDEYKEAKNKVKEHKKYVKKYHTTMMDRVYQHTEL